MYTSAKLMQYILNKYKMYSEEYKHKAEKLGQKFNELNAQFTLKVVELEDSRQAVKTLESRVATMERENKSLRMFGGGYNTSKSMSFAGMQNQTDGDGKPKEIKKDNGSINQNTLREMMVKTKHNRVVNNAPQTEIKVSPNL
jgi:hypothetical protein